MVEMGMSRPAKVMRVADDSELDKAVYAWFQYKRMEGMPITGAILCEKAVWFNEKMNGEDTKFTVSSKWQWWFRGRHGIRSLSVQGEKLSANDEAAEDFRSTFQSFVQSENLSLHQIFNCNETGCAFACCQLGPWQHHLKSQQMGTRSQKIG